MIINDYIICFVLKAKARCPSQPSLSEHHASEHIAAQFPGGTQAERGQCTQVHAAHHVQAGQGQVSLSVLMIQSRTTGFYEL